VQRARTARASSPSVPALSVPAATRSQRGAVERERWDDDVHARAVGQSGIDERLGLVDPAADRRQDPLDRLAQLGV
jgi:hypothetical protein